MTEDEQLRVRLAGLDPLRHAGDLPPTRAHEILEQTMTTIEQTDRPAGRSTRWRWGLVAAAAVAVVAVGAVVSTSTDDTAAPLTLTAPGGTTLQSCLPFSVPVLADMPIAFAGTVSAIDSGAATVTVDHWYAGGDADQVVVEPDRGVTSVSLDGVDFVVGERYLLTASAARLLNGCGYSGPATADFEAFWTQAFGDS